MSLLAPDPQPARGSLDLGSGDCRPVDFLTFGVHRWRIHETTGVVQSLPGQTDGSLLELPYPFYFFRVSGPYRQFCVKFPGTTVQILATDPG